jgi:GMP synthase (glutamine-hydrolysing)
MTRILIVDSNGPGMPALAPGCAAVLQALSPQITCSFCAPYLGQALPEGAFDGVVFTGSAVSWGVDAPEGEVLREIWRQVTCWKVPIWGSCNGMQLAAFMLGGQCAASPHGDELGMAEAISLTDIGRGHPMMQGRASQFRAPTVHRDEVQAFAYETADISFWGTQYHPEFSQADVAAWLASSGKSMPETEERDGQGDLSVATRTLELQNWLAHVTSRHRTTGAK